MEPQPKPYIDPEIVIADVRTDATMLWLTLTDGRVIGAPLGWSARLRDATCEQLRHWELTPSKTIVYWPDVDEHISARVLLGHPS